MEKATNRLKKQDFKNQQTNKKRGQIAKVSERVFNDTLPKASWIPVDAI